MKWLGCVLLLGVGFVLGLMADRARGIAEAMGLISARDVHAAEVVCVTSASGKGDHECQVLLAGADPQPAIGWLYGLQGLDWARDALGAACWQSYLGKAGAGFAQNEVFRCAAP